MLLPDDSYVLSMTYRLIDRIPTLEEHRSLSERVGWGSVFRWDAIAASLAGTCCGAVATIDDGTVIGMGRVIGDGAYFFYLQDLAVDPTHQGRGVGSQLVQRLVEQVKILAGGDAFIGLFATSVAAPLYRRAGFDDQTPMQGMWQMARDHRIGDDSACPPSRRHVHAPQSSGLRSSPSARTPFGVQHAIRRHRT